MKTVNFQKNQGFGLIEIIITATIIVISFTAFLSFILFSRNATLRVQRNTEAVSSAEESIEVVRKLKDDGWTANIVPLVAGTTYYPKLTGNTWTLVTTNPSPTSYYTPTLVFSSVSRDSNSIIVPSGGVTAEPNMRKVVAPVTWNDSGTKNVQLTTYIANLKNN